MHAPAHGLRPEQAGIARRIFVIDTADRQPGKAEHAGFDMTANEFHGDSAVGLASGDVT